MHGSDGRLTDASLFRVVVQILILSKKGLELHDLGMGRLLELQDYLHKLYPVRNICKLKYVDCRLRRCKIILIPPIFTF